MLIFSKNKDLAYIKLFIIPMFLLFIFLILTFKNIRAMLYNYIPGNTVFTAIIFIFVIMLWCIDLNASSMSESLAMSLLHEWKNLQSFPFLQPKNITVWTLNFLNLPNRYFNFILIAHFVSLSCNSGSNRFKISTWSSRIQLSEEFDCTPSGIFREI